MSGGNRNREVTIQLISFMLRGLNSTFNFQRWGVVYKSVTITSQMAQTFLNRLRSELSLTIFGMCPNTWSPYRNNRHVKAHLVREYEWKKLFKSLALRWWRGCEICHILSLRVVQARRQVALAVACSAILPCSWEPESCLKLSRHSPCGCGRRRRTWWLHSCLCSWEKISNLVAVVDELTCSFCFWERPRWCSGCGRGWRSCPMFEALHSTRGFDLHFTFHHTSWGFADFAADAIGLSVHPRFAFY